MHMCMKLEQELTQRLTAIKDKRGLSKLAERAGLDQGNLSRALGKENQKLGLDKVSKLLDAMGARVVFPDQEEDDLPLVKVRMAGAEIGAGSSFFYEEDEAEEAARYYSFREDFIRRLNAPLDSLRLYRVRGTSMEPDIRPGDVVLVHLKEGIVPGDGDTLVVRLGQELLIKQTFIAPGGKLLLRSKNRDWPDQEVFLEADDFQVLGVPRWIGRQL